MDPIYYQVNQTKLTEVTQKSSDNLRLQSNKEAKRKSQATEVDKSAMSTDTSSMSDDMLGNMDPDDYGGSGAKKFAQMWKEQLEEKKEEKEPEEESEQEEPEEGEEPEDESAPNKEEAEIEAPASEIPSNPVSVPAPATPSLANGVAASAEPAAAKEAAAKAQAEEARVQAKANPVDSPSGQQAPASTAAPEKFDSQKVTPPTGPPPPPKKSSMGSLLDFSSGFLIAEEAAWDPEAREVEAVVAEVVAEEPLAEEISILLERLVRGDSSQPSYRKLNQLLSRFGRRVLQLCVEAQAKVYLLPPGERLQAHPELAHCGYTDLEGAAYLPQQRLCLVEDACLAQPPHGFHPVFYYFAHLYDHALGGESFASLKSAAVKASYLACLEGAHRFGDLMASHSPAHYFAQAIESYLAENDCCEPLWTRQDLYDFDRSIYNYIEYLLK